jgi:hypothetical protein
MAKIKDSAKAFRVRLASGQWVTEYADTQSEALRRAKKKYNTFILQIFEQ